MKRLFAAIACILFLASCNNSGETKNTDADSQHFYYFDPGDTVTALTPDSTLITPRSDSNEAVKLKFPEKKNK